MKSLYYPGKDLEAMFFAPNYYRWILDLITPYLGSHIVEVGAGIGYFSQLLLSTPIEMLDAFEPSSNLHPVLSTKFQDISRIRIHPNYFHAQILDRLVDTITYINVLEHIENDQAELINAYKALKPGGYLIIFVPALTWLFSQQDQLIGHFRRYTRQPLITLLESSGFQIVQSRYFDIAGILPWYIHCTLLRNTIQAGNVSLYDQLVVPIMRRVEAIFPPPIGKNILLIAQKPG